MKITILNNLKLELIIVFLLITFGVYLSLVSGYGSDEDTLPLIGAFESMMSGGQLMASRFTPYPVAELGIGFLSYNFGSGVTNLVTFFFTIIGIIFFYLGVTKNIILKDLIFFLLLCLSSPVLFFDNLEPIDYSWAFLPLALGIFSLKKNYFDLTVVLFGISIGTRIYFIAFVLIIIFCYEFSPKINIKRKLILFFSSFFIGGLFYLSIWFENGFGLTWLTAVSPNDQGILGLSARFFYKTMMSFSLITFLLLVIIFLKNFYEKKKLKRSVVIISIILINLLIFFFIPAELSYLQPMLIAFYYLIVENFSKKILYLVIFAQLISWVIEINPLQINYNSKDKCNNVQAISASISFSFTEGRYFQFINTRDKIKCWIRDDSTRSKKILEGKALKN